MDKKYKIIIFISLIAVLLICILVPISFGYLDYYDFAFKRQKSTGSVDTRKVYETGRYLIGPDYDLKKFKSSAHHIKFSSLKIFTNDNLEVEIIVDLQYFLIKDDLKLLHDSYDVYYESIIENNAKDALKNSVTKFETDEFISNRSRIQNDLFNGVRQRLSGRCCLPGCKKDCETCKRWEKCDDNCKPRETCTKEDKGFFAEVRYLQLHGIIISSRVIERKLLALITALEKEKEGYIKEEQIIRKETEYLVQVIKNNASELIKSAEIKRNRIIDEAYIDAEELLQTTHNKGLANMTTELELITNKHKASFYYLHKLKNHEKVKYSIDYNTLVQTSNSK